MWCNITLFFSFGQQKLHKNHKNILFFYFSDSSAQGTAINHLAASCEELTLVPPKRD